MPVLSFLAYVPALSVILFGFLSSAEANIVDNIFNSNIIFNPRVTCVQVGTLTKQLQRRFTLVQEDFIATKSREYFFY